MATVKTLTPQQIAELEIAAQRVAAGQAGSATANNAGDIANLAFAKSQYGWTPTNQVNNQVEQVANQNQVIDSNITPTVNDTVVNDTAINSSSDYRQSIADLKNKIDSYETADNSYVDTMRENLKTWKDQEIANLESEYDAKEASRKQEQKSEVGQRNLFLAGTGALGRTLSGQSNLEAQQSTHKKEILAIQEQRDRLINEAKIAYSKQDFELAKEKYNQEQEAAKYQDTLKNQLADMQLQQIQNEREDYEYQQTKAKNTIEQIVASGQELTDTQKQDLASKLGMSLSQIEAYYNNVKNKESITRQQELAIKGYQLIDEATANTLNPEEIIRIPTISGVDEIYKLPYEAPETQVVTAGGRQKLINKQTGEVIADLGGAYKTESGGGETTTQLKQIEKNLIASRGADGYVSPDDYALAKQDWITAGGAPADFDTKFKNRRNPNNPYYEVTGKDAYVAPYITKEWIISNMGDEMIKSAVEELGYKGFFKSYDKEKETFLTDLETRIQAFRDAGYSDKEIEKMLVSKKLMI